MSIFRVVADLGNSRLKWGRERSDGSLDVVFLPIDDLTAWESAWASWNPDALASSWCISTVNPSVADRLGEFLKSLDRASTRWYRSAADVPVRHHLENPQTAGTDRAFAVLGALAGERPGCPGLVISCGSAITVDRISADGVWEGGAIAPGLRLAAEALHAMSSQLPLVTPQEPPGAWGRSTVPALESGVFWGTVGVIRTLVDRQSEGLDPQPWCVWSGGDAGLLMGPTALRHIRTRLVPSLVLEGLRAVCEV